MEVHTSFGIGFWTEKSADGGNHLMVSFLVAMGWGNQNDYSIGKITEPISLCLVVETRRVRELCAMLTII